MKTGAGVILEVPAGHRAPVSLILGNPFGTGRHIRAAMSPPGRMYAMPVPDGPVTGAVNIMPPIIAAILADFVGTC